MLTKQQAIKLRSALSTANKGSARILSALTSTRTGKITASAHRQYSKELKVIKSIADKAERHLLKAFSTSKDVIAASKIDAVEKLLVASAELSLRAKIMSRVLADADELSELPDGTGEFVDAEDDINELPDAIDAEGEESVEEVVEDEVVEADDEVVECEDEEVIDADEDEAIADEVVEDEVVEARKVKARKALRKQVSAKAKVARRASVKAQSLSQANRSLINWDFPCGK